MLAALLKLDTEWTIDLRDAVAIYRTDDGKLRLDQSVYATSREGATWGGLLGGLLGAVLAAPFTAGASAAAAAVAVGAGALALGVPGAVLGADDAATWKDTYGVPEDFVRQVGGMVEPGQSAVLALIRVGDPAVLEEEFRGQGGTVIRALVTTEQTEKMQRTIEAQRPEAR
ncbi:MAG TPA: DUF1269 domain-containing protein [Gemmatimonadaceae bacterium]|nr:DUF1269 domain-containing protein [Gemmatimonadaceae bacterium]